MTGTRTPTTTPDVTEPPWRAANRAAARRDAARAPLPKPWQIAIVAPLLGPRRRRPAA